LRWGGRSPSPAPERIQIALGRAKYSSGAGPRENESVKSRVGRGKETGLRSKDDGGPCHSVRASQSLTSYDMLRGEERDSGEGTMEVG
jgi:hypothetical protein